MSIETSLVQVLQTMCPRVFPGDAPVNVARPFVTWQHVGGDALRYMDGSAAAQRHALVQINTWATTSTEALELALQIEDTLCITLAFVAKPMGAPRGRTERDVEPVIYGAEQLFEVIGPR